MKEFTSKIDEKFNIKRISDIIKKPYSLVHRAITSLLKERFLIKDKQKFLSLNCKQNLPKLAYIESLRNEGFLKKNKTIALFVKDVLETIKPDFFIFLIFGSSLNKKNARDVDVLFIINTKDIGSIEKILTNLASNFSLDFDIRVISVDSAYEMLNKKNESNIMNETLGKHIIIFGAENYYRILKNVR